MNGSMVPSTIMLSTGFLIMLFTNAYMCSTIDTGVLYDETDVNHIRKSRGYLTAADLSDLKFNVRLIKDQVYDLNDKLTKILDKSGSSTAFNEKFQTLERKLDLLTRAQEEQESYGNKLTALEFTLNHVLSKVVYLSDNIHAGEAHKSNVANNKARNVEILSRLHDLLRHVQSIERGNCRRSTLPAAAGPVISMTNEKSHNPKQSLNNATTDNATLLAEAIFRKIEQNLTLDTIKVLQELPVNIKKYEEQLADIIRVVKQNDKRLEHWSNDDSQQQNWQRMLQYCQDVSDEFSTFTGNSDVLLKRIEASVHDMANKVDDLISKQKESVGPCVRRRTDVNNDVRKNDSTLIVGNGTSNIVGFDDSNVYFVPEKSSCEELIDDGYTDGVYRLASPDINSAGRDFYTRYCAFATDERAWTVIQRRDEYDVQENFNRSWADYRNGFGDLTKDFWFGNEFIHRLTAYNNNELLIELENFDGGKMSILYGSFSLDREQNNYNLFIGTYKGPGPDSLSYHSFMDFSTYDHNGDKKDDTCCACAIGYGSGWWFDNCLEANLNGIYRTEPLNHSYVGIIWEHWLGDYSLKASRMLIRPKNWTIIDENAQSGAKRLEDP